MTSIGLVCGARVKIIAPPHNSRRAINSGKVFNQTGIITREGSSANGGWFEIRLDEDAAKHVYYRRGALQLLEKSASASANGLSAAAVAPTSVAAPKAVAPSKGKVNKPAPPQKLFSYGGMCEVYVDPYGLPLFPPDKPSDLANVKPEPALAAAVVDSVKRRKVQPKNVTRFPFFKTASVFPLQESLVCRSNTSFSRKLSAELLSLIMSFLNPIDMILLSCTNKELRADVTAFAWRTFVDLPNSINDRYFQLLTKQLNVAQVERLELDATRVTCKSLRKVVAGFPKLRHLSLKECRLIEPQTAAGILFPNVRSLQISIPPASSNANANAGMASPSSVASSSSPPPATSPATPSQGSLHITTSSGATKRRSSQYRTRRKKSLPATHQPVVLQVLEVAGMLSPAKLIIAARIAGVQVDSSFCGSCGEIDGVCIGCKAEPVYCFNRQCRRAAPPNVVMRHCSFPSCRSYLCSDCAVVKSDGRVLRRARAENSGDVLGVSRALSRRAKSPPTPTSSPTSSILEDEAMFNSELPQDLFPITPNGNLTLANATPPRPRASRGSLSVASTGSTDSSGSTGIGSTSSTGDSAPRNSSPVGAEVFMGWECMGCSGFHCGLHTSSSTANSRASQKSATSDVCVSCQRYVCTKCSTLRASRCCSCQSILCTNCATVPGQPSGSCDCPSCKQLTVPVGKGDRGFPSCSWCDRDVCKFCVSKCSGCGFSSCPKCQRVEYKCSSCDQKSCARCIAKCKHGHQLCAGCTERQCCGCGARTCVPCVLKEQELGRTRSCISCRAILCLRCGNSAARLRHNSGCALEKQQVEDPDQLVLKYIVS